MPEPEPAPPTRPGQLLLLSASSDAALEAATADLAATLERRPDLDLADVAYTLHLDRPHLEHRRALVCAGDAPAAVRALRGEGVDRPASAHVTAGGAGRPVVFLLPGEGAEHPRMGDGLLGAEPGFRSWFERCRAAAGPDWDGDLARFAVSYAMAMTLADWGVRPAALLGHGAGEHVAACVAGALGLEDALALTAASARLERDAPPSAALVVLLRESELAGRLPADVGLAAVDGPARCVVCGPPASVAALRERLSRAGVSCRPLPGGHVLRAPGAASGAVGSFPAAEPAIPFMSGVSGGWARAADLADPGYWDRQARVPVRFAAGLAAALELDGAALLDVGPGTGLTGLARQQAAGRRPIVSAMRRPADPTPDRLVLLGALAQLWLAGVAIDWAAFWRGERRHVVALPAGAAGPAPEPDAGGTFEADVAEIWRRLLDLDRVDRADDFFDIGGSSALATVLLARVVESFGVEVPVRAFFDRPTVAGVAACIEELLLARIGEREHDQEGPG